MSAPLDMLLPIIVQVPDAGGVLHTVGVAAFDTETDSQWLGVGKTLEDVRGNRLIGKRFCGFRTTHQVVVAVIHDNSALRRLANAQVWSYCPTCKCLVVRLSNSGVNAYESYRKGKLV